MSKLLLIDTSTDTCSVAVATEHGVIIEKFSQEFHSHASKLAPMIKEALQESNIELSQCDAIVVCEGPGSYTGLRVGVSTAKGLCYGSSIPLLSCSSLEMITNCFIDENPSIQEGYIVPMVDARRMEVYTALFTTNGKQVSEIKAKIIDSNSYTELLHDHKLYFVGDGAAKCSSVITSDNAIYSKTTPLAHGMLRPALRELENKNFKNVAYFTPFYLKDFVITKSKKSN